MEEAKGREGTGCGELEASWFWFGKRQDNNVGLKAQVWSRTHLSGTLGSATLVLYPWTNYFLSEPQWPHLYILIECLLCARHIIHAQQTAASCAVLYTRSPWISCQVSLDVDSRRTPEAEAVAKKSQTYGLRRMMKSRRGEASHKVLDHLSLWTTLPWFIK